MAFLKRRSRNLKIGLQQLRFYFGQRWSLTAGDCSKGERSDS
jgi:hypothetical protein